MRISIPVNGDNMQSGVSRSFGRAPYFLFYDTAETFLLNKFTNILLK